jgi:hypothetical protein
MKIRREKMLTLLVFAVFIGFVIFHKGANAPLALKDDMVIASVREDAWNGRRAMDDIAAQLALGVRAPGTPGHEQAIAFIKSQLAKTAAASVDLQPWTFKAPDGKEKALTNIVARFFPANPHRILLATHYDSIIRAYRDHDHPQAPMPGANNSASGVALLLETARVLSVLPMPPVGVDMVFFDGEEGPEALGEGDKAWAPLGSLYFAEHLKDWYPGNKPKAAAVFDMVCYHKLTLKPERFSLRNARDEVEKFWTIGVKTAPAVFDAQHIAGAIGDDQLALLKAGIPALLVIGFAYEPWYNTTQDTLDKCAPESLEAVGRTLLKYLYTP